MKNQNLSDKGLQNSNTLITLLKSRLQSNSKTKRNDGYGNSVYVASDIYSDETLLSFIELSISEFNQTPQFSFYTLENSEFINCFAEVLVEGAALYALSSQALIERGHEFMINDNGIYFNPPSIAEMLNTQFVTLLSHHNNKLKHIKEHIHEFNK